MAILDGIKIKRALTEAANGLQIIKMTFEDFTQEEFDDLIGDEARLITWVEDKLLWLEEKAEKQAQGPVVFDDYEIQSSITTDKITVYWESRDADISFQWKAIWNDKIRFYLYVKFDLAD